MRQCRSFSAGITCAMIVVYLFNCGHAFANQTSWFDRKTTWNGYEQFHFNIADRPAYIVAPKEAIAGKPWVWRARFPGYHAEMDIDLLGKGFHVAYVDVSAMFGSPSAVSIGNKFYEYLTTKHGFSKKPALEGVSRGGLFVYNWAANNPEKVACIYCDTPVCDFKSWPGGKGDGLGSSGAWAQCLKAYGLNEAEALNFEKNPIDNFQSLTKYKIPILHIVSENDRIVPPEENTYLLNSKLEKMGHFLNVISVPKGTKKSSGHHFDHPKPQFVVNYIEKHANAHKTDRLDLLKKSRRIVFLGDSITYAGHYVAIFETWLFTQKLEKPPVVINVGLPSETVSGLSEEGHAGGRFPRPDLAERLDRVLAVTNPDLVFACYGINCGIYQPMDDGRYLHYQKGIQHLKRQVEKAGAKLVMITPPFYDDQRAKKPFSYNAVLTSYSQWLLSQRDRGWNVIDLHSQMTTEILLRRKSDPNFTFQPDAVHPNTEGHWFIASRLIKWFGDEQAATSKTPQEMLTEDDISPTILKLTQKKSNLLRDSYLSSAGHKRPGINSGLPLLEAQQNTEILTKQIQKILMKTQ